VGRQIIGPDTQDVMLAPAWGLVPVVEPCDAPRPPHPGPPQGPVIHHTQYGEHLVRRVSEVPHTPEPIPMQRRAPPPRQLPLQRPRCPGIHVLGCRLLAGTEVLFAVHRRRETAPPSRRTATTWAMPRQPARGDACSHNLDPNGRATSRRSRTGRSLVRDRSRRARHPGLGRASAGLQAPESSERRHVPKSPRFPLG
jgi:hypothetical protein